MTKLSEATQYSVIGDGLAVGCADLGVTALTSKTLELKLSFNHAWRRFPIADMFPQVHATLDRCDLLTILDKSPGRRWSRVAWNQARGWWEPTLRGVDNIGEVAEDLTELYGVDRERWTELVGPFVEHLGADCVRGLA